MITGFLKIETEGRLVWQGSECTQTLETLPLGGLHRTVNGELIYTGGSTSLKYRSICTGKGNRLPDMDALKRGDEVTIHCIQRLWQGSRDPEIFLVRAAVPETVVVMRSGVMIDYTMVDSRRVTLSPSPSGPVSITYCPILIMRVEEITVRTAEWSGPAEWTLVLEEV